MRAINLDTYSLSLLTAKEDILNPRASTNWYGNFNIPYCRGVLDVSLFYILIHYSFFFV